MAFIEIIINSMKSRLKWEDDFNKIKEELQTEIKTLQDYNGYAEIKEVIDFYLLLMPFYRRLLNYWEDTKKSYKNL